MRHLLVKRKLTGAGELVGVTFQPAPEGAGKNLVFDLPARTPVGDNLVALANLVGKTAPVGPPSHGRAGDHLIQIGANRNRDRAPIWVVKGLEERSNGLGLKFVHRYVPRPSEAPGALTRLTNITGDLGRADTRPGADRNARSAPAGVLRGKRRKGRGGARSPGAAPARCRRRFVVCVALGRPHNLSVGILANEIGEFATGSGDYLHKNTMEQRIG